MNEYGSVISERVGTVEGVGPWMWITSDTGAWDGPKTDWENNHSKIWFQHVKNYDTVIQAGGCQGVYPRLLSTRFKHVYTFEPDPLSFHCLVNNCQVDNVYKINAALGSSPKMIAIDRTNMSNVGMHKVKMGGRVPMLTVDSFEFEACDLIALDLEGYEYETLLGATKTIEKFKPVITCECGNEAILSLLHRYGYEKVGQSVSDSVYACPK